MLFSLTRHWELRHLPRGNFQPPRRRHTHHASVRLNNEGIKTAFTAVITHLCTHLVRVTPTLHQCARSLNKLNTSRKLTKSALMENIPSLSKYLLPPGRMSRFAYHDFRTLHERDLSGLYSEKLHADKKDDNAYEFVANRITEVQETEPENEDVEHKEEIRDAVSPKNDSDDETKNDADKTTDEDKTKGSKEDDRNSETFVAVIAQAILSVPTKRMTLSSIYNFIARNYPHFDKEKGPGWRNSVRHNLSSNDCFVKASRAENGKGHYWMIHPKDLPEFAKGNFRRRRKPRRPKCSHPLMFRESPFLYHSFTPSFSTFPYTAHLRSAPGDLPTELPVPLPYGSSERTLSPAFRPRLGLLSGYDDSRTLSTVSHAFTYPTSALRFAEASSSRSFPPASGLTNFHGSFHYPCACHRWMDGTLEENANFEPCWTFRAWAHIRFNKYMQLLRFMTQQFTFISETDNPLN